MDPLNHPLEPSKGDDLVTLDALNIVPTSNWTGGYFAAYQVYLFQLFKFIRF